MLDTSRIILKCRRRSGRRLSLISNKNKVPCGFCSDEGAACSKGRHFLAELLVLCIIECKKKSGCFETPYSFGKIY
jgi:hypothetical protein